MTIEEAREAFVQAWKPKGRRPMFNRLLLGLFDDAMLAVHVEACGKVGGHIDGKLDDNARRCGTGDPIYYCPKAKAIKEVTA